MKKLLIIAAVLTLFACNHETDYSPREVNYDRDICAKCLMGIADKKYAVQSISQWGEVVWFDDLGCYVNYFDSDDWNRFAGDGTVKSWIGNCETGEWIELGKAWFRFGDRTPMGYGYGALDTNVGDSLFNFDTTAKKIKDGNTKRKEFLEQRGMMGH